MFTFSIFANIFAAVCEYDTRAIGASTSIAGLIAGMLAMIIVNWSVFDGNPQLEQLRCCFVAMTIFMLVMMVLLVGNGSQSDILGHLGGAIFGFLFGMGFYPRPNTPTAKTVRKVGLGLFTMTSCLMIGLLFGLHANKDDGQNVVVPSDPSDPFSGNI